SSSNPDSLGCSFDFGWNAARHSFDLAATAAQRLHQVSWSNARHRAANVDWWLDVEILNTWRTPERDTYVLLGAVRALWDEGVINVGIYSTWYGGGVITGGSSVTQNGLGGIPVWLAGYTSHWKALAGCSSRSFTGGPVRLAQYLGADGYDANAVC